MFGRIDYKWRRRIIITTALSLVIVLLAVYAVVRSALRLDFDVEDRVFELSESYSGDPVAGFGLNLETVQSANLLKSGAFEPEVQQNSFFATDGTENSFVIPSLSFDDPLKTSKDYYDGAKVRIYSQTQDKITLRQEAEITDYLAGQVQNTRQILLPADVPEDVSFNAVAEYNNTAMLCGDEGYVLEISPEGDTRLHNVGDNTRLISIAGGPSGWVALSSNGNYHFSLEGRDWAREYIPRASLNKVVAVVNRGKFYFLACGDEGKLFLIDFSGVEEIKLDYSNNLNDIYAGDDRIVICGSEGLILSGDFDFNFQKIEGTSSSVDWLAIDGSNEGYVLCGTLGGMAYSDDGLTFSEVSPSTLADVHGIKDSILASGNEGVIWPTLVNCARLADEAVLFQTSTGQSWLSKAEGENLIVSPYFSEQSIASIASFSSGQLLAVFNNGSLEMANMSDIVTFSPELEFGSVQSGDLIFLEKYAFPPAFGTIAESAAEAPSTQKTDVNTDSDKVSDVALTGVWYVSEGASFSFQPITGADTLTLGNGCVELAYEGEAADFNSLISPSGDTVVSVYNRMPVWLNARAAQKLDLSDGDGLKESFYRLELYLRQEGLTNNSVHVWLSGLETENVGHTVEKVGSSWEKHQFIFVLGQKNPKSEIWLNLGFSGQGSLWLDQVWFGSTQDEQDSLPQSLNQQLTKISPEVLRLDFVPIGVPGMGDYSWLYPEGGGSRLSAFLSSEAPETDTSALTNTSASPGDERELHNLGAALKMTLQVDADAWLVVDSMVTDLELYHLIEYIAGSPTSEFGKIRSAQGAVGRWSDQLDRIYLEIQDSSGVFDNDTSRMIFVNHVIETIQSAQDYSLLENKIVLVDGMDYDSQILASNADYHAAELHGEDIIENYGDMRSTLSDFLLTVPTRRVLGGSNAPEIIKSFDWQSKIESLRLADYAALVFGEAGDRVNLVLIDAGPDLEKTSNIYSAICLTGRELSSKWALAPAEETVILGEGETENAADTEAYGETAADNPEETAAKDEQEKLLIFSFTAQDLRTVVLINLGDSNISMRLSGKTAIVSGEVYNYDARASLLAQDEIKSSRHIYRVMPGGIAVLVEKPAVSN